MSAREQPERIVRNPYEFPSCGSATPSTSTAWQIDHQESEINVGCYRCHRAVTDAVTTETALTPRVTAVTPRVTPRPVLSLFVTVIVLPHLPM